MILIPILAMVTILIIFGYSFVIEAYLKLSSETDPESAGLFDLLGLWGVYVLLLIATAFFYLTEDLEFEIEVDERAITYIGRFPYRWNRKIELEYSTIDTIKLERPDEDAFLKRGHRLLMKDGSRPFSITDPNSILLYSTGFTRDELIRLVVGLNVRLHDTMVSDGGKGGDVIVKENVLKEDIVKENVLKEDIVKENVLKEDIVKENVLKEDIVKENVLKEDIVKEDVLKVFGSTPEEIRGIIEKGIKEEKRSMKKIIVRDIE